jgi:hypothetical protein
MAIVLLQIVEFANLAYPIANFVERILSVISANKDFTYLLTKGNVLLLVIDDITVI